ncbi:MAG TPA: ABC transporter permease [Desulfobacterales bacterium]|jgi:simple sugar transport system permease protein|nr:ABC transporter permease [Desulfobacterales bacterium]
MIEFDVAIIMAGVIAGAAPIVMATLGETLTEKAGVVNLSLDGTILLAAMAGFVVALKSGSLSAGFLAGAAVGAAVAAVVAVFGVYLGQNQVAVGFVLTLMTRDLAYFLGNPYSRKPGLQTAPVSLPLLDEVPFLGPGFFNHHLPVYFSMLLIAACWWYLYRTAPGLTLQAVGENPEAAYARGTDPRLQRCVYAICGGALVGLAGATFSLCTKPGWGRPQGAEGTGWIALALVIFGGWHPVKAALGAYVFSFLQMMGIYLQGWFPSIPAQVFQVAPFPLMIFALALTSLTQNETVRRWAGEKAWARRLLAGIANRSPAGLGRPYSPG